LPESATLSEHEVSGVCRIGPEIIGLLLGDESEVAVVESGVEWEIVAPNHGNAFVEVIA
jgi:hypothetical protein